MSLLISLLVFIVVLAVIFYILTLIPLPQPWKNIVMALVGLIALLILLSYLGFIPGRLG